LIGRAAAIFRVDEIIIYSDNPRADETTDTNLLATLLDYVETPQYLRKRLFKLEPELQYAGILPPLRTPHHPLNRKMKSLKVGEYREGVALSRTRDGTMIDIGVEQPAVTQTTKLPIGKRVTVRISNIEGGVQVEPGDRHQAPEYWGYRVTAEHNSFGTIVRSGHFDLTIATSKYGTPIAKIAGTVSERWARASVILVAFGAPSRGLNEIAALEKLRLNNIVDFVINTIPMQGTETVRTEEALIASLAALNLVQNLN
jgi:predicted SPOUT superfamily RNA methylase MTH1